MAPTPAEKKWKQERKALLPLFIFQFFSGLILSVFLIYGGYYHCDSIPVPQSCNLKDYLIYYARCCVFPATLVLLFSVLAVSTKRGSTPAINPLAGKEHVLQVEKNILMNTVEQTMLFLMVTFLLTTYLSPAEMKIIPLYATQWVVGRVFFSIGYKIKPQYRSFGMLMNFFGLVFFSGLICYFVYSRGFMYGISGPTAEAGQGLGDPSKTEL